MDRGRGHGGKGAGVLGKRGGVERAGGMGRGKGRRG